MTFIRLLMALLVMQGHAEGSQKCIDREISKLITAHEVFAVSLNDEYFKGIGRAFFETCFVLKKGDVVDVFDEKFIKGVQMLKIRDPQNDIYVYFPRERLASMTNSRMQVKDKYFERIGKSSIKSCFTIRKGKSYQATGSQLIDGKIMVEIQDDKSKLFQLIPTKLLDVRDPRVVKVCGKQ